MANISTHSTAPAISLTAVFRPLGHVLARIGHAIVRVGEAHYEAAGGARARYLNSLSDEELAARGIERADIPRIVFRKYPY